MEIELVLDPVSQAPARARAATSPLADALPAGTFRDLRIVVSELITNAVRYGPPEPIELWVSLSGSVVRGEVADAGRGGARIDRGHAAEGTGLGLQIVDALCSAWCNPSGTGRVWFHLDLDEIAV